MRKNLGKASGGKDIMWRRTQVPQTRTSQLPEADPPKQARTDRRLRRELSQAQNCPAKLGLNCQPAELGAKKMVDTASH